MSEGTGIYRTFFEAEGCRSLLKKHLTRGKFEALKEKQISFGGTLDDCIRSGVENIDSLVGLYASDPGAYTTFAGLFDPVIKDYHSVPVSEPIRQPPCDFGNVNELSFKDLDPEGQYIVSTRVRVARCLHGYGFPPTLTRELREEIEKKTCEAFGKLTGALRGTYHSLTNMKELEQKQLMDEHFLFHDHSRFRRSVGGYDDWPIGRGIFYNEDKNFLVWINEGDHLRLISMQKGGDLGAVYKRLVKAVLIMGETLAFARDERLGFLTFCPSNLGTSLRASVHMKIPRVSAQDSFKATCEKLNLQVRGTHGEHTEAQGGVYDISNKRRLGLTEIDAVTEMYYGVKQILQMEKEFSEGHSVIQDNKTQNTFSGRSNIEDTVTRRSKIPDTR
ncbi:hypothetical protein ScPMuIL_012296 [Solemya velum]